MTRLLEAPIAGAGIGEARFHAVLQAYSEHLERDPYPSMSELEAFYAGAGEVVGPMAAEVCGYQDAGTPILARKLAIGLALAELARRPARAGGLRWTDAPLEEIRRTGVTPADLAARHTSAALRALLEGHAARAGQYLTGMLREQPAADRGAQRSRLALAEMTLAHLAALARADFRVLEGSPAATPLRKLWIAWKYRRRD